MELLIKRAQKGNHEAFIEVINQYMPQLYKVARTRLKSEEDIGDAIQETILSAFNNIKKLKEPCYFSTWITKILINKCNDIFQSNKILYVEDYEKVKNQGTSFTTNESLDEKMDFNKALSSLNDEYRTAIVMFYVNKFTIKEIGEILGEKEGTIKSRLSRARQQLKAHYLDLNGENLSVGGNLK